MNNTKELTVYTRMDPNKHKPAVKRKYLILISGLMWTGIGIMLISLALTWLLELEYDNSWIYIVPGAVIALFIHHFGFLRIVDKNLGRIKKLNPESCVFAFMSWKSYILVLVMISMGIFLRHSQLPRNLLAIIYIGIGLALFLSSIRYLRVFASKKHRD